MRRRLMQASAMAALSLGLLAPTISAGATPAPVVANTVCSKGSLANLQLAIEDNGTLNVDFGIDMAHHVPGVTWYYRLIDNHSVISRGTATTAADGSLSITKTIAPRAGTNHVIVTARNPLTGEVCRIKAAI